MIELLAPAGNLEILKSAVDCGADAVYCGLSAFNARINANNFLIEDFREGASYCHRRGSRIYLTLNTLIGDSEMESCIDTAVQAYEAGCDGILIQDVGLMNELHKRYPSIPLHCSTQMNVFSEEDLKNISELGVKRIVLPRELSIQEIASRTRTARRYGMETEVFAHGAVCVCYSGLCLFSAMNKSGSRSGNRGLCAQPCREEYSLHCNGDNVREGHLLSPKDRDVTSYIRELIDSGTASLKLEGRMRDRNYVMSAVSAYRRLIDSVYDGTYDGDIVKEVRNSLLVNFNRGGDYTSQFLTGKKQSNFLSGEYPGKYGLKLGKVSGSDSKKGTVTFSYDHSLPLPDKGDYLSLRRHDREVCSFPVGKIHEMPRALSVKGLHPDMIAKIDNGTDVFLMGHKTVIDSKDIRKTEITLSVDVTGSSVICNASVNGGMNGDVFAEYEVDLPEGFEGAPLPAERIRSQLMKFGDTPFRVTEVYFTGEETVKCPVSLINELRRGVADQLINEIDYKYERAVMAEFVPSEDIEDDHEPGTIKTMFTYPCIKDDPDMIEAGAGIYAFSVFELGIKAVREKVISFMSSNDSELCLILPDLYHDRTHELMISVAKELHAALGSRFAYYMDSRIHGRDRFLDELGLCHILSPGANVYNTDSYGYAAKYADTVGLSYELAEGELIEILRKRAGRTGILIHEAGDIPWMQSDFCAVGGNEVKCRRCFDKSKWEMSGRNMDDKVRIIPRSYDCSSVIYGRAKNYMSYDTAQEITELGYDVIVNKTFL